jgi:mono/diheme cytochrome c family protein
MRFACYQNFLIIICILKMLSCKQESHDKGKLPMVDSLAMRKSVPSSPILSPAESLKKMKVEEGFVIKLVAAEPLVTAPVALTFDEKGRIWADEMVNYMPDTVGTGEDKPAGKIVILEDKNKDGIMDDRKVFMDGLVLPRALCFVDNGILIAEPPNLWFVEINNDQPGKKILVDDKYAAGGNAEHQANGLMRALDNWIYSANSDKRYRKKGDHWLIERTHARGQWGISQDNYGRLFYNNNSQNLLGDYFTAGLGAANTHQQNMSCYNEEIIADNKVFPIRPTPGVNRGYMKGVLNDSLRLVNFTAASGPVLYRGGLFGNDYLLNAFVAEPSANLIKRNILTEKGNLVQGRQAYAGREFLSSTDERFRPVTLYNGPDGALYVADMYRGIIQHKTYLTDYLKNEIKSRSLTQPLTCGRIYKIVPQRKQEVVVDTMPTNPERLVKLLGDANGWVRDKAQQMIIDGKFTQLIPALRQNLQLTNEPLTVIHSLWTMEGLAALKPADILPLLKQGDWIIRAQALSVLPSVMTRKTYGQYLQVLNQMAAQKDTLAAPYIAFNVQSIRRFNPAKANSLLLKIVKQNLHDIFVADAVISTLQGKEQVFLKKMNSLYTDTAMIIKKRLKNIISDIANSKNKNSEGLKKEFPKGAAIFNAVCQTCHGGDGNGISSLAPPLNKSEWVTGDKDKLLSIVLYGLTGPVKVNGKVYKAPEINGEMPGIGNNKEFSDEAIAQLLSFIRKSWSNKAEKVDSTDIDKIRKKFQGRQKSFTTEELK